MSTVLVTGTSGHLGRLVVEALLDRGHPASDIVATARNVDDVADLADGGVVVRHADYADPASLKEAFAGVDRAVLVSSSAVGERVEQHRNVIEAAAEAGIELIAYTSVLRADTTSLLLAADHVATEQLLTESGLPTVLLRNSWYLENYTAQIALALEQGAVLGAAGDGRVSGATRADYAAAVAAVLAGGDHAGRVYELGGDAAFTVGEYAAEVATASGRDVVYRDLPVQEYASALVAAGLPEGYASLLADSDRGIAAGELFTDSGDLSRLIGRPTTPLAEAIRGALRA
jgi:NAD(P)H dehydrogenase (quinone)